MKLKFNIGTISILQLCNKDIIPLHIHKYILTELQRLKWPYFNIYVNRTIKHKKL